MGKWDEVGVAERSVMCASVEEMTLRTIIKSLVSNILVCLFVCLRLSVVFVYVFCV